ncbi:protein takeout-like, partial [Atheta coriaria]|uniref:protein takeout-like n=1 Tax=Dalotia coriaria TaxID=877792 RepID=UPI0031F3F374
MKCNTSTRMYWITLVCFAIIVNNAFCKVPDYIKVCSKKNGLSACLMQNFKDVLTYLTDHDEPAFKVQNFRAIHVPKIDLQATADLKVSLKDVVFTGLEKSAIKEMSIDDTEIRMLLHSDEMIYNGKYQMNGKILILPIEGEGTMRITQKNFDLDYKAKLKIEERKGKKYYYVDNNPEDTKIVIPMIERVIYQFDNLFGGDPNLGPEMNIFLNENWKEVFNEIKVAVEQTGAYSLVNPIVN